MKKDISTILLATDFLPSSRLALDYAAVLASKLNAKLVIANAFELGPESSSVESVNNIPSRTRKEATAKLDAFAAGCCSAGVSAIPVLVEGPVSKALLSTVDKFKADLLVVGTQGVRKGLGHMLIGSNTEAMMLRSPIPTLAIGPHVPAKPDHKSFFKKVIYVSNLRPASAVAAPFALRLSQTLATDIEIYQVVKQPDQEEKDIHLKEMVEEYCSKLRTYAPDVKEEWCSPEFQMKHIVPPLTILEKSMDPSVLMVLGVRDTPWLELHFRTSYPYRLLANAACPIITVHN
jgi:nucleotide-binding universal stress UspA family protein